MSAVRDQRWQEALSQHEAAFRDYVEAASKIDASVWMRPSAEGKWSPAEITEHLRLAYEAVLRELNGGNGVKVRTGRVLQIFLRLVFLQRILKTGKFPKGAKAPHEMRPAKAIEDRSEALAAFQALAEDFQNNLSAREDLRDKQFAHHVFGRLSALEGLQLVTRHLAHHQRQLPS